MGRVDIPLGTQPPKAQELPRCGWCGAPSGRVCSRCKARGYCSAECQRLDWHSGHSTACTPATKCKDQDQSKIFKFFDVPYCARWAINLKAWDLQPGSKELQFLTSALENRAPRFFVGNATEGFEVEADGKCDRGVVASWSEKKKELAKELAVRRLAEVFTQAMWHKVEWSHDPDTGRDFLVNREEYIWTGQKYLSSNTRFPNFNFSFSEAGDFLFLVSHPVAITGVYAGSSSLANVPDPRVEFANDWLRLQDDQGQNKHEELSKNVHFNSQQQENWEGVTHRGYEHGDAKDASHRGCMQDGADGGGGDGTWSKDEGSSYYQDGGGGGGYYHHNDDDSYYYQEDGGDCYQEDGGNYYQDDTSFFGHSELKSICSFAALKDRRGALRRAITGKLAFFRTVGQSQGRPWTQVVLVQDTAKLLPDPSPSCSSGSDPPFGAAPQQQQKQPEEGSEEKSEVSPKEGAAQKLEEVFDEPDADPNGKERRTRQPPNSKEKEHQEGELHQNTSADEEKKDEEETCDESTEVSTSTSARFHYQLSGQHCKRWRVDIHDWKGYCVAVTRAPPNEVYDPSGAFKKTLSLQYPEIDLYDEALEHDEPPFIEVPIQQLLPEKWQEDYARSRGESSAGDRTRINYLGRPAPHVPHSKITDSSESQRV